MKRTLAFAFVVCISTFACKSNQMLMKEVLQKPISGTPQEFDTTIAVHVPHMGKLPPHYTAQHGWNHTHSNNVQGIRIDIVSRDKREIQPTDTLAKFAGLAAIRRYGKDGKQIGNTVITAWPIK